MSMSRLLSAAAALALLTACGLGAPAYPTFGNVSYRIEGVATTPEGQQTPTVIYRDGPKMRVETQLANNTHAVVVFDQATHAAYVLTATAPAQPAQIAAPQTGQTSSTTTTTAANTSGTATTVTTVAPTPPPPQVIGVATRVADADAPQPMEASWEALGKDNAQAAGDCEAAGERGHQWRPRQDTAGVERTACITDDGIVLKLTEGNRVLFQASRLERGPQPASMFGVPPGYQTIDPTAVAQQVGDTMQHLDSVTGSGTTPAPAQTQPQPRPPG